MGNQQVTRKRTSTTNCTPKWVETMSLIIPQRDIMKRYKDSPYYVTNDGRVYRDGKQLKPSLTRGGYHRVTLSYNGKQERITVHRLVAKLYIPNPENKPYVNHINHIRDDNRMENLEWVTHSEKYAPLCKT